MTSADAALELRGLRKEFDGVRALDVEELRIEGEGVTGLIGPNGAGKTTLFDLVTGFVAPSGGRVAFGGVDITRRPAHAIARAGLVRTFQLTRVLGRLTVLDNVVVAAAGQRGERISRVVLTPRAVRREQAALRSRAAELLELVGLSAMAGELAGRLSGGQTKLLELARALMLGPRMLLLDEPLAGVNPTLRADILGAIERLRDRGAALVLIEHDVEAVMRVCGRIVVLAEGRPVADGPPAAVRRDPAVLEAYLGADA